MRDEHVRLGPVGQELRDFAKGSLATGCQTAIIEIMACIDDVMQERGMSRRELAEAMGVDPSRISRLLNDPDNITIKTFYRLCNALGLKPSVTVDRGPRLVVSDRWITKHADGALSAPTVREAGESIERKGAIAA